MCVGGNVLDVTWWWGLKDMGQWDGGMSESEGWGVAVMGAAVGRRPREWTMRGGEEQGC